MPAVDKRKISLQLPIKTIVKLDKVVKNSGLSRNEVANAMLDRATANVVLDDEDLETINSEIRSNREKRGN